MVRVHERTKAVGQAGRRLAESIEDIAEEFGLTVVETTHILTDALRWQSVYLLRQERHPDDPSKKADEE